MNIRITALLILFYASAPLAELSLSINPGGHVQMMLGETKTFQATATGGSCASYTYTLSKTPKHGRCEPHGAFSSNGEFTYTHEAGMHGKKMGAAKETITVTVSCGSETATATVKVSDKDASCAATSTGMVILDNTATPGVHAIKTNLAFFPGCDKDATTIDDGYGGNSINIDNYHTLSRDTSAEPHSLRLQIGAERTNVAESIFGTEDQLNYFAAGKHLFELNRLRTTADWLSANVTTLLTPAGTYGTISFSQFLENIANDRTMYGVVRVKVGLEKGQCTGASCTKNALGDTVASSTLYGFCGAANTTGACACAPGNGSGHFTTIQESSTICGIALPASAKIKVKGSLLWDFVDHVTGTPIALTELPFAPKELYFKVEIPIVVNGAHDADDDGAMDNMDIIKTITNGQSEGLLNPTINFSDVPQSSKDQYNYETGKTLSADFASMNTPSKYHMLMASGYADGWAEAFTKLQINAATWATLPPDSCRFDDGVTLCPKFTVPSGVTGILSANNVRNDQFEDIPAYLYTGGLVDMHDHVNISGLLYVPQAMELEAKNATTRQFVNGGIVVRDGFFIEANDNTVTIISADPASYSTAKIATEASNTAKLSFVAGGPGASGEPPAPSSDTYCFGCGGRQITSGSDSSGSSSIGKTRWMEIIPQ